MDQNQNNGPQKKTKMAYIDYLEGLVRGNRRDVLAALRSGLGKTPGEAMDMHRYMAPWLERCSPWEEQVYYLIGALFAYWHQGESTVVNNLPKNLGASMALLSLKKPEAASGLDRRFTALLKCHRDNLPHHLRQAVAFLKAESIPVNWEQLFWDLRRWSQADGKIQRSWANSFWGRQPDKKPENQAINQ
jgi:CRISPR system Cascade subunit CasB